MVITMYVSKYLVNHFSITPENFPSVEKDAERRIKSLYIPIGSKEPKICFNTPGDIKSEVFKQQVSSLLLIPLHPYYHMYVVTDFAVHHHNVNFVATCLYRSCTLAMLGFLSTNVISGDVLVFGSASALDQQNHEVDYSVPYELVEQISRYYDQKMIV